MSQKYYVKMKEVFDIFETDFIGIVNMNSLDPENIIAKMEIK
jgi:hypothetical protein